MRPIVMPLALACSALPALGAEVLIGSGTFGTSYGIRADYQDLPCAIFFTVGGATLFDDRGYTPEDVGQSFSVTQAHPGFAAAAAQLTNGFSDRIEIFMGVYRPSPLGIVNSIPENYFWGQYPLPDLKVAAAGRPISRIEMTVVRADITWDGSYTTWTPRATWNVYVDDADPADFNGDGEVNVQDLIAFLTAFGSAAPEADLDGNGAVGVQDLIEFLTRFARS